MENYKLRRGAGRLRLEQLIVGRVVPDPKPLQAVGALAGEGAVVEPHSCGVEDADFFEANRRMSRVASEEFKVFVGKAADFFRKLPVVNPEVGVGEVLQSGVQQPAW